MCSVMEDSITGNYFGAWLLYHACCFVLWPNYLIIINKLISKNLWTVEFLIHKSICTVIILGLCNWPTFLNVVLFKILLLQGISKWNGQKLGSLVALGGIEIWVSSICFNPIPCGLFEVLSPAGGGSGQTPPWYLSCGTQKIPKLNFPKQIWS